MADNYLEKRMEDLQNRKRRCHAKPGTSINTLLRKNRSHRGYNSSYKVSLEELKKIIAVNSLTGCTKNQQILRFKPLTGEDAVKFNACIKLGGMLPELHLPLKGTEPNAFIIVCTKEPENKWTYMDLGISVQSMLLKAVSMGLNGICIGSFNKETAKSLLPQGYEPLIVVAIGKGIEKIELVPVSEGESLAYYRKDGVHYVPKIQNLII